MHVTWVEIAGTKLDCISFDGHTVWLELMSSIATKKEKSKVRKALVSLLP